MSLSRINRFLMQRHFFFKWKILLVESHGSSQAFKIITQKFLFLYYCIYHFLLDVISRSQLPQNSKILYYCFRKCLLRNRHGKDWNIIACVVLVSPWSVQELPSRSCMRHYLFETRKSRVFSKSLEKKPSSLTPLCFGFFSVDIE